MTDHLREVPAPDVDRDVDIATTPAPDGGHTPAPDDGHRLDTVQAHEGVDLLRGYGMHDVGNSERLKALYGHCLRYNFDWKKWAYFDFNRWRKDETGRAMKFAKQTIAEFLTQAIQREFKDAENFARKCLNTARIKSMLEMAQSEMPIRATDFDKNPYLLNCANGTIDLRTGELQPHRSADFLTKIAPVDFDPEAPHPLFTEFLNMVMGMGPECSEGELERVEATIDYLQRAVGYSATALTIAKAIFVLIGDGDNGKTTFLEIIRFVLGDYAQQVGIESLTMKKFGESLTNQADIADLQGARYVTTSEAEQGTRLAEAKLKYLSQGMGEIKTCRKYENPITFPATHTLWIDSNFRPRVSGRDGAIWARLKVIRFDVKIENPDQHFLDRLKQEAPGILAWVIEGCLKWQAHGLEDLPGIMEAGEVWRKENDPLKDFIEDRCILDPARTDLQVIKSNLRSHYAEWAKDQGERFTLSVSAFADHLEHLGCTQGLRTFNQGTTFQSRQRAWIGITLKNPITDLEEEKEAENEDYTPEF